MTRHLARAPIALLLALLVPAAAMAQRRNTTDGGGPGARGGSLERAGRWALESAELKSGAVYRGLVQSESKHEIEFMEIVRPPGKPMFLVIRPIARRDIARLKRLPQDERLKLVERTNRFRKRVLIEAGQMEDVELDERNVRNVRHLRYAGEWFTLVSTADEETTRRCVVRIEQIFRAYRLIIAPRTSPRRPPEVFLLGSMDEYHNYLRRYGPALENPSFYLTRQNRIVAASELTRFSEHLAESRARHEQIMVTYDTLDADLPQRLQQLTEDLKLRAYSRDEIVAAVAAQRNAWEREKETILDKIAAANRRNDARFEELTRRMFTCLYHEAFHAYLENYVYPHEDYQVPRWLNEGLAQVFESGQLEGDTLRIDAPSREALGAVQKTIASDDPPAPEDVLMADEKDFLTAHGRDGGHARQTYYLSWALAYYLTFLSEKPLWGTAALDEYVTPNDRGLSPTVRFELLVGMPLSKFAPLWRDAMKRLKPAPR